MLNKAEQLKQDLEDSKFNRVSKPVNVVLNILFGFLAFLCVVPFIFVVIISLTSEESLRQNGYRFLPTEWSIEAYKHLISSSTGILKAYGISIIVTISGTILGLLIMTTYAYALSRKNFDYRKFYVKLIFIPMLFSGGLVSSYLINVRFLNLKDSIWALILPICVSSFNIIILRTFFKTSVPESIVESAKIDGASEFKTFLKIVMPIAVPGIATIGLFLTLAFWNDWFNAMLYIENKNLIPLQYLLMKIEKSIEFLTSNADKLGVTAIEASKNLPKETIRMAIVVVTTLPIIFAYPFFQKYFVNGLTIGAVKE